MRRSLYLSDFALSLALVLLGCAGPPPPEPPTPADGAGDDLFCPVPREYGPGEERPVRIRLENPTSDTLSVFLDRCYWHTWMASVPPGKARQARLPSTLVLFPEGLRFRAYDRTGMRRTGIFTVPPESGILRLRLGEDERVHPDSLVRFALDESQSDERVGSFAIRADDDGGWVALWATEGMAVATWSCAADRRSMAVSLPDSLQADEAQVLMRRGGEGEFETSGRWATQQNVVGGSVVAPDDRLADVERWFGGEDVLDFLVDDDGARRVHRFRVAGLGEALDALGCWRREGGSS